MDRKIIVDGTWLLTGLFGVWLAWCERQRQETEDIRRTLVAFRAMGEGG